MGKQAYRLPFAVISISSDRRVPLYRQLYSEFRSAILTGRLKAGNNLPPTRELANELGISRSTVMIAYDQLLSEGYIEGRVGSGTCVTSTLPEEMLESRPIAVPAPRTNSTRNALSKRGQSLVSALPPGRAHRGQLNLLPFRIASPDLASFPFEIWTRLLAKYSRNPSPDLFGYAHA